MSGPRRGVTTVTDRVTARIARQAAAEATAPLGGHVLSSSASRTGRSVEVAVAVDLPLSAPADADRMARLRNHLVHRTGELTGQVIAPARIRIRALGVDPPSAQPPPRDTAPPPLTVRGSWSRRRPATACLALALAGVSGLLLWTATSWHLPAVPAPPWPRVEDLVRRATTPAVVRDWAVPAAALAGAWLILLAATPGRSRGLPLGCASPARARTTRRSAARLVHGALLDVPGLRVRGVRFTARRVTVRAEAVFGSPDDTRDKAVDAVAAAVASLPLARGPVVRVVLREGRTRRREGRDADG
ncbi:DUF6286 domain-containing protein [Streptomyces sp. NPDC014861]|uniref:DUF6286 domain-containing protein n=1 Tax=Streptomyces sp. NPDC014861 TaxID=3364923 RepID=UPI003700D5F4